MSELAVLSSVLPEGATAYADRIRGAHIELALSAAVALNHALAVGALLREARELFPKQNGGWHDFVTETCGLGYDAACTYMQLSRRKDEIPEGETRIRPALDYIRALSPSRVALDVAEARRLRKDGKTYREVGAALGVDESTIRQALGVKDNGRTRAARRRRQERAETALRREEQTRFARAKGGPAGAAFDELANAQRLLHQAIEEADPSKREALAHLRTAWSRMEYARTELFAALTALDI